VKPTNQKLTDRSVVQAPATPVFVAANAGICLDNASACKDVLDNLPYAIQLIDLEGQITYCNAALIDLLGYSAQELMGRRVWDFQTQNAPCASGLFFSDTSRDQPRPSPCLLRFEHKAGDPLDIQLQWVPQKDAEGKPIGFLLMLTDITPRLALEHRFQFYTRILQNVADALSVFRASDGIVIYANPKFVAMFGYVADEIVGAQIAQVFAHAHQNTAERMEPLFAGFDYQQPWIGEQQNTKKDGTSFWTRALVSSFEHDDEGTVCVAVFEDITAKKAEETKRQLSERKYRDLFENSRDAILIIENEKFVECNQATLDMLGYHDKEEFLQQHPSKLSPLKQPDGRGSEEKADEMMKIALEKGSNRFEWDHVRANGEVFPVEVLLTPLVTENGTQVIHTVWRDITVQKQQRQRIYHQANYDSLTDLPNRLMAMDRLEQALKESQRHQHKMAVFFLDLDNFKKVNDTLGHDWGDKVLLEASRRLKRVVRSADTVGRLGGDEFIILLTDLANALDASVVANHLLDQFRYPFTIDGRELVLTTSIGIACYPDDGTNASDLLRRADTAMYHSKEQGRNNFHFFTEQMNRDVSRRLLLEEKMHGALTRGEFSLRFQPLIDLSSLQVIGAEALLRWENATLGHISPDEFIPVSEQTGHIVQIGEFVLREALQKLAHWQHALKRPLRIAINISPRQFRDPTLLQKISNEIATAKVDSSCLELEITEGVLMSGLENIKEALSKLHAMGVNIAMDDFGTGYSSMSYLRNYPFDTLKIDRSFVRDIIEDQADRELVSATVALAHGLGLKVVAEGIENIQQLNFLKQLGCDYGQGYFFSRPITATEFQHYLKDESLKDESLKDESLKDQGAH